MDRKLSCGVCGVKRPERACHIIELTEAERKILTTEDYTPPTRCIYCKPCWKTLSDPNTGPSLMKGLLQVGLRHLGVSNAEALAKKYHHGLVEKIAAKRSSS